jgi:hypothetical protein
MFFSLFLRDIYMNIETEHLISVFREESVRFGLISTDIQNFWIIFRIMDFFYTQTMEGNLDQSLFFYCRLLKDSTILSKYGSLSQMIHYLKHREQTLVKSALRVLQQMDIPFHLNPGSVITILQMCRFGSDGGGRIKKSRKQRRRRIHSKKK